MTTIDATPEQSTTLACPRCGLSNRLGTVDTILATALIDTVYRNTDGSIEADFVGETEIHWDTQVTDGTYECTSCGWEGRASDLVEAIVVEEEA